MPAVLERAPLRQSCGEALGPGIVQQLVLSLLLQAHCGIASDNLQGSAVDEGLKAFEALRLFGVVCHLEHRAVRALSGAARIGEVPVPRNIAQVF